MIEGWREPERDRVQEMRYPDSRSVTVCLGRVSDKARAGHAHMPLEKRMTRQRQRWPADREEIEGQRGVQHSFVEAVEARRDEGAGAHFESTSAHVFPN
eukprot:2157449-Rhodomonas_salina.1